MAAPTLAIDFGTTRTKVAFFDAASSRPRLVELGREVRAVIPSVFYIPREDTGERLVGDDAQDMVDRDPAGIVISLKKEIHKLGKKRCGPNRPVVERIHLAADLFAYVRCRCQEEVFHGEHLLRCRITVPVDFKDQQRQAICQAAQLGGFQEVTTMEEPVAAAHVWLGEHAGTNFAGSVMVCDVGGGTTDFAFLRFASGRFEADDRVLSAGFSLGGNDLDESIWEQTNEQNPAPADSALTSAFLVKIRRERELLSKSKTSEVEIRINGQRCVLSREVVQTATKEFVDRVKTEAQRFLETIRTRAGLSEVPILMVGGASRLPGMKEALASLDAGEVFLWNDSDYATVLGAVEIPAKASPPPNKKAAWEEYGKAVEVAWADQILQRAEYDYLLKLQAKLGVSAEAAGQIETTFMGRTKETLISGSQVAPSLPRIGKNKTPRDWANQIHTLIGDAKCEQAFEICSKAMMENPDDDWFDLWWECAGTMSDADKVLTKARELSHLRENDMWSAACLALALLELGRTEEAEKAVAPFRNRSATLPFALALVDYETGFSSTEATKQELLVKRLVAARPNSARIKSLEALHLLDKPQEALNCLDQARRLNPHCFGTLFTRTFVCLWGGVGEETAFQEDLKAMERIAPKHFSTVAISGVYMWRRGDFHAAGVKLDAALSDSRVLQSAGFSSEIFFTRAACRQNLGNMEGTMRDLEDSLRLNPTNGHALTMRGQIRLTAEQVEAAFNDFHAALSAYPNASDCLVGRGRCFVTAERWAEALADFESACSIDGPRRDAIVLATFCLLKLKAAEMPPFPGYFYVEPDFPPSKMQGALQSYLTPQNVSPEKVMALFDNTFLGGAEDGFCLTEDGIYWHNDGGQPSKVSYAEISRVERIGATVTIDGWPIQCAFVGNGELAKLIWSIVELHHKHGSAR